eukprot:CAMPEP_0197002202 /NCGR_PEP_ID=MMETSP1380-20130617/6736_1 /TAXON_ID=5936 /ORGANISM="Euplotes crassus, Strain CT5" /LENGTH=145 /DNA_ID=CAMNT_0042420213 /DNA_START=43 /DNA_END=480 /DNA_ORIENTATION=+
MRQNHRNKSVQLRLKRRYSFESHEHRTWRLQVIQDHFDTEKLVNKAIDDIKTVKEKIIKNIKEMRVYLDRYDKFKTDYKKACKRLEKRIDEAEEAERVARMPHYMRPVQRRKEKVAKMKKVKKNSHSKCRYHQGVHQPAEILATG